MQSEPRPRVSSPPVYKRVISVLSSRRLPGSSVAQKGE